MLTEKDIIHENGDYAVIRDRSQKAYVVQKNGFTHAVTDSAYELSEDGQSIAIARCDYLAKRQEVKEEGS